MNTDFFIDIGITVLLRLLKDGHIPSKYVKGLTKLRDALNLAFPPDDLKAADDPNPDPGGGQTEGPGK